MPVPKVELNLPDNFSLDGDFRKEHILPFFLGLLRKHFSTTPDNRYIPANQDLVYSPLNVTVSTINIEPFNGIFYLIGNWPTVFVQVGGFESPNFALTDRDNRFVSELGTYWRSNIFKVVFSCLASHILVAEHLASELMYLLINTATVFGSRLPWHRFEISEITPPKVIESETSEGSGLDFHLVNVVATLGLTEGWVVKL